MHNEFNVVAMTLGYTMSKINSRINLKQNMLVFRWMTIHSKHTKNEFQFITLC